MAAEQRRLLAELMAGGGATEDEAEQQQDYGQQDDRAPNTRCYTIWLLKEHFFFLDTCGYISQV
jgi:hypothetical protein